MSKLQSVAVILAVSLVTACSHAPDATAEMSHAGAVASRSVVPDENVNTSSQSEQAGIQCPSRDFDPFLKAFANNVKIQKAFTHYPYKATIDDAIHMDAGVEISELTQDQVKFPVMLGDAQLVEHGAVMESARKSENWFQVSTHSEGSGAYSMTFNFHFQNSCWYLTDSLDTST